MAPDAGTALQLRSDLLEAAADAGGLGNAKFETDRARASWTRSSSLLQWQRQTLLEQLSTIAGKENRVLYPGARRLRPRAPWRSYQQDLRAQCPLRTKSSDP